MLTYLADQVKRVRDFMSMAGYYSVFAKYVDLLSNAKNVTSNPICVPVTCTPLEVCTMWEFTLSDAAEINTQSITIFKIRTINDAQSQTPEGEYTDYIGTQPSLIKDGEDVDKQEFASRLVAVLDLVKGTGAEYAIPNIKTVVLTDLLNPDTLFGGVSNGHVIHTASGDSTLHTRYFTFLRPNDKAFLVVDGKTTQIWE
jgi:hypothetical protein